MKWEVIISDGVFEALPIAADKPSRPVLGKQLRFVTSRASGLFAMGRPDSHARGGISLEAVMRGESAAGQILGAGTLTGSHRVGAVGVALRRAFHEFAVEKTSDRPGEQGRQKDEISYESGSEEGKHQDPESLRGGKRAEREGREAQPGNQRRLGHGGGASFVGPHRGPFAIFPLIQTVAEPCQEVDRVIDGHAEGDDEALWHESERRILAAVEALLEGARAARAFIVVSNEVGSGLVPTYLMGRRFRDLQGRANQLAAAKAETAALVVAGLPLLLKGSLDDGR